MTTLKRQAIEKIFLFEDIEIHSNPLKEFLYYLKYRTNSSQINFSYSSGMSTLHPHLSIKDNFIIDAIPTSVIKNTENTLINFLGEHQNHALKELIFSLGELNRTVRDLSHPEMALASIVKAFLSQSKYILLDSPDKYLQNDTLDIIKNIILFEAKTNRRIILLKTHKKILWPEIITNIISKDEKNNYIDSLNALYIPAQSTENHYSFSLNKKAS